MDNQPPNPYLQQPPPPGPPYAPPQPPSGGGIRLGVGLALLVLPLVALVIAYVLPTLRTIQMSTQDIGWVSEPTSSGTANYERVFGQVGFFEGFVSLALPILGTVIAGAVIAPLVAWCLHRGGSGTRMAGRILLGSAAFALAPVAMVVAWILQRVLDGSLTEATILDWTSLISGVVLGVGVLVALAAFRGGADTGKTGSTVVVAASLTGIALIAAGLQTFTFTYVLGEPSPPGATPVANIVREGFQMGSLGSAAVMSVIVLAILAVLGLAAALLFVLARVRIDVGPGPDEPRRFGLGAGLGSIALLLVLGAGIVLTLWPWLSRLTTPPTESIDTSDVMVNTWVPPLITTGIALVVAVAGGLAIGALRPFGDGSRWLLLLFAPWLFVGTGPFAMAHFEALRDAEQISTFAGLIPRAWIAVPALFVFTALFWGLEDRRQAEVAAGVPAGKARAAVAGRAWPLVIIVGLAVLTAHLQDVIWQLTVNMPTAVMELIWSSATALAFAESGVNTGAPLVALTMTTAAMVIAAIFYLPRVGVRVGR